MGSEDGDGELIETVMRRRADDALVEIKKHYPTATVGMEMNPSRGVVTFYQGRFILSREFVETSESLSSPLRMIEYRRILQGKARLVLIVPKVHAVNARMRLLEFNNWWLFYYQVFFYDDEGNIKRVDRKTWRELMGRPYEAPPRAPEIV